jgi:hypothetical protein
MKFLVKLLYTKMRPGKGVESNKIYGGEYEAESILKAAELCIAELRQQIQRESNESGEMILFDISNIHVKRGGTGVL